MGVYSHEMEIEVLRKEVKALRDRVDEVEGDVRGLSERLGGVEVELKNSISQMEGNIRRDMSRNNTRSREREDELRREIKEINRGTRDIMLENVKLVSDVESIGIAVKKLSEMEEGRSRDFRSFVNKIILVLITAGVGIIVALIGF